MKVIQMASRRIMIVDDVAQVRQDLRTFLGLAGEMQVVGEASNGLDAISQAASLRPDVILMDLEMPLVDGYEAARQIKKQQPGCRVIALTVHNYPQARLKAELSGMDGFIVKGEPVAAMLNEIQRGVENERER